MSIEAKCVRCGKTVDQHIDELMKDGPSCDGFKAESPKTWIFTFGYGHAFPNRYVKIWGTCASARAEMFERFGPKWAFQYTSDKEESLNSHNVTELK